MSKEPGYVVAGPIWHQFMEKFFLIILAKIFLQFNFKTLNNLAVLKLKFFIGINI